MRTTVTFEDDVAAALEQLRRERDIGVSEAVNELIRAGLATKAKQEPYRHRARKVGLRIDVTNVAEALELLEGPDYR
jgi:hypothetical protein